MQDHRTRNRRARAVRGTIVLFLGSILAAGAVGCSDSVTAPPLRFEEVEWAQSLGIHVPAFTELHTGIWIRDDVDGDGPEAADGNRVRTDYRGWLPDGTQFDSSFDEDRSPLNFVIGAGFMIRGFELAMRGMRAGGVRTVLIPSYLGYGSSPPGSSDVPPNSWLVFEIHLLEIVE